MQMQLDDEVGWNEMLIKWNEIKSSLGKMKWKVRCNQSEMHTKQHKSSWDEMSCQASKAQDKQHQIAP